MAPDPPAGVRPGFTYEMAVHMFSPIHSPPVAGFEEMTLANTLIIIFLLFPCLPLHIVPVSLHPLPPSSSSILHSSLPF